MEKLNRLGEFILFRKLVRDPLGEIFRAGEVTPNETIGDILLLRVFRGAGIPVAEISKKIQKEWTITQDVSLPGVMIPYDGGTVEGIPYLVYEYSWGKTAIQLVSELGFMNPLPMDLAILIVEKIAETLECAEGITLPNGERMLHGFLVPETIFITSEGEVKIKYFEISSILRSKIPKGVSAPKFAAFLSPEAKEGAALTSLDDVYSCGALLFTLLSGSPPPTEITKIEGAIDSATLAEDESENIPDELKKILNKTLTTIDKRYKRIGDLRKALTSAKESLKISPSPFDLACFINNSFSQEIKEEEEKVNEEKEINLAAIEQVSAVTATGSFTIAEDSGISHTSSNVQLSTVVEEKKSSNKTLIGGLIATLAIAAIGGFVYLQQTSKDVPKPTETVSEETLQKQQEAQKRVKILRERLASLQEKLNSITKNLQAEKKDSKRKQALEQALKEITKRYKALQEELTAAEKEIESIDKASPTSKTEELAASIKKASPASDSKTVSEGENKRKETLQLQETSSNGKRSVEQLEKKDELGNQKSSPPISSQETTQKSVTAKDSEKSAHIIPPRLVEISKPSYPLKAQKLRVEGIVVLKVLVNEEGKVEDIKFLKKIPQNVGLNEAAYEAAKTARFIPAKKNGKNIKYWFTLPIPFKL